MGIQTLGEITQKKCNYSPPNSLERREGGVRVDTPMTQTGKGLKPLVTAPLFVNSSQGLSSYKRKIITPINPY
jgi:hypothetical protein